MFPNRFPEGERIFATCVGLVIKKSLNINQTDNSDIPKMLTQLQSFNVLGAGVSYLVGPLAVPYSGPNGSIIETKENIQIYMIGLAAAATGIFLGK